MKTQTKSIAKSIACALLGLVVLAGPLASADEVGRAKALAAAIESEGFEISQKDARPGIVKVAGFRGSNVVKVKAQSFATLPNRTSGILGLLKQANAEEPGASRRKVKLTGAEAAYLSFTGKGTTLLFATKTQAATFTWIGDPTRKEFQTLAAKLAGALGGSANGGTKAGLSGRLGGALAGGGGAGGPGATNTDSAPVLAGPGGPGGLTAVGPTAPALSATSTQTSGAGFYVAKDMILTSGFVAPKAKTVRLTDSQNRSFSGEVVGRLNEGGITLTLIRTQRSGTVLPFAKPQSDQAVFAFGSTKESREKTKGKLERSSKGAFVISGAALSADHTGGPLVDAEGRALGLLFTRTTGQTTEACAVPATKIKSWLAKNEVKVDLASPTPGTELYAAKKVQTSVVRVEAR
jgi:trypsin-like peptidase